MSRGWLSIVCRRGTKQENSIDCITTHSEDVLPHQGTECSNTDHTHMGMSTVGGAPFVIHGRPSGLAEQEPFDPGLSVGRSIGYVDIEVIPKSLPRPRYRWACLRDFLLIDRAATST